jgi:sirohydrochlorin ferrochelatase
MKDDYPIVEAGFLELAEPSIPEVLDRSVRKGATDIYIVPYFLSAGRHVHVDIPGEVAKARAMYNGIAMTILPHIGASLQMKDLFRNVVRKCAHAG